MDLLNWMFDNHPHVMTAVGLTIGGGLSVAIIAVYDVVTEIDRDQAWATVAGYLHGWQDRRRGLAWLADKLEFRGNVD